MSHFWNNPHMTWANFCCSEKCVGPWFKPGPFFRGFWWKEVQCLIPDETVAALHTNNSSERIRRLNIYLLPWVYFIYFCTQGPLTPWGQAVSHWLDAQTQNKMQKWVKGDVFVSEGSCPAGLTVNISSHPLTVLRQEAPATNLLFP